MKKTTQIGLLIIGMLFFVGTSYAQFEFGEESKDHPKKPPMFCPKTQMNESCLLCHTTPSFKLKEAPLDEANVYPNADIKIRHENGHTKGFYYVSTISSHDLKEAFDYFNKHKINHIVIEIHSPGGSVFDAWRMAGLMGEQEKFGKILETRCYGFAASAGFLIMISGTKGHRYVNTHAELMWHELLSFKMFDLSSPSDKEEQARVLRHLQDTGNDWLAQRCNLTKAQIDKKVKKREFWMTGTQAVKYGFADGFLNK